VKAASDGEGYAGIFEFAVIAAEHAADKVSAEMVIQLIDFMHANPNQITLQLTGCRILRFLARDHQRHRVTIRDAEGIEAILCAMTLHPTNVDLLEFASRSLLNLAQCSANAQIMAYLGGVNSWVVAMREFPDHADLQEAGCEALGNIAGEVQTTGTIFSSDVIGAILEAMRNHVDVVGVQEQALFAIGKLCQNPDVGPIVSSYVIQAILER
jgi:hypothetical protein